MYDANELLARLVAIETEAITALLPAQTAYAKPLWFWQAEGTPYWINRVAQIGDDPQTIGDEGSLDNVISEMGLIYGEVSAGFDFETETAVNDLLPDLTAYLRKRVWLTSAAAATYDYSTRMKYLHGAYISLASNLTEFPATPSGARRIGILFRAACQFYVPVEQDDF